MLGQIVRRIRRGHKKSLAEWAQILNISVSALSRLEKGETGKQVRLLETLSGKFLI